MIKSGEKQVTVVTIEDVLCNMCGQSCRMFPEQTDNFEFVDLSVCWGYYSEHDNIKYKAHMCEQCYFNLIVHFMIPPEVEGNDLETCA